LVLAPKRTQRTKRRKTSAAKRALAWILSAILVFYAIVAVLLVLLRWIDPPFTAVQVERRFAASAEHSPYRKRYRFVPIDRISLHLRHAVIAAEDTRFFQHHGFDWKEIGNAVEEDLESGRRRGASTITQQLVRNLFLSTGASALRKAIEFSIVPLAEGILSKNRILEIYLNVIEWGPGVYGAEAASQYYFEVPAERITREQAVELAEILPAPLHRRPDHVSAYGKRISQRMHQTGF
jgi:monofunctional biosynthetic peptidoglycan transglycosylase